MNRVCTKCNTSKELSFFSKSSKNKKYGVRSICKICVSKEYLKYKEEYESKYNESISNKFKRVYIENKNKNPNLNKEQYAKCDKTKAIERSKKWRKENVDYINKWYRSYRKRKNETDVLYRLKSILRSSVSKAITRIGSKKDKLTMDLLGSDIEIVRKHIERQFKKGMTWDNNTNTGWHIDHIIPLSSAKTIEELKILFHYTNLQPLWYNDNLSKANKIPSVQLKATL